MRRAPGLPAALLALFSTIVIITIGYAEYSVKPEVLLLLAAAAVVSISAASGVSWKETQSGMLQSILKGLPAMLIVIVVGALIASWLAAGIIPMIIYYGLGIITPRFFLLTASAAACVVSCLTGTGYGTIGTIGVAFMGIAHGLGIPPGPAAGALVAGAYLGDKVSPLAANSNLACAVSGVNIYDHIRHCLWTTVPALAVGFIAYFIYGGSATGNAGLVNAVDGSLRAALAAHFVFSPWLLIPPAITLYAMARRHPVIPGMIVSIVAAVILAVWLQHAKIGPTLNALGDGYTAKTGVASVDKLLSQGGMSSMMRVTLIALVAFAYSGALQKGGLLEPILVRLIKFAHTPGRLILTTGCACVAVELLTGSAFLCILLPGELFGPAYRRMGLAAKNLSRTIGDFGIVGVPLIPWSIAGAFMSGTLGVSVGAYAPWAIFCYVGALFTLIAGFTGWTVARRVREDETQPGS